MDWFRSAVDWVCNPPILFTLIFVLFFVAYLWKKLSWIWTPRAAAVLFALGIAFVAFGMTDPNFRAIVSKPDNVPIVAMLFWWGSSPGSRCTWD